MRFEAEDISLGELFTNNSSTYIIPRYQRPFSWSREQISELWNDLLDSYHEKDGFFFGTMIFCPNPSENSISIVDGQQRFTTLTILYASIRDALLGMGEAGEDKANRIQNEIITSTFSFGDRRPTLSVQDNSRSYFNEYFQMIPSPKERRPPKVRSWKRMHSAYVFFSTKIDEVTGRMSDEASCVEFLWDFSVALSEVRVIRIDVEKEDDAYVIFETVNARGTPLDASDLIKNHVFRKVRESQDGSDTAKFRWDQIRANLTNYDEDTEKEYNLTKFIRYHWMSKYGFCTVKELYRRVRERTDLDMDEFLNDLVSDSKIFGDMLRNDLRRFKSEIEHHRYMVRGERSLKNLGVMGIDQCYVFILSMCRNLDRLKLKKPKRTHEVLKYIERFNFVYHTVCGRPANRVERLYSRCAVLLESAGDGSRSQRSAIEALYNGLRPLVPPKEQFIDDFSNISYKKSYKSRAVIRYVFTEFERFHSTGEYTVSKTITIEHVLPREPEPWGLSRDSVSGYVNGIGNLVLLSQPLNSKAGNKDLEGKIEELGQSDLHMTRELVELIRSMDDPEWGRKQIEERCADLASRGYDEIWKIG